MKKWEKEILQKQIADESNVTVNLEKFYKQALQEVNDKIQVLMSKILYLVLLALIKKAKKFYYEK